MEGSIYEHILRQPVMKKFVPLFRTHLKPAPKMKREARLSVCGVVFSLASAVPGKPKKRERWLLTRKTWRYMADAGKLLIPESMRKGKDIKEYSPEDLARLEEHFHNVCDQQQVINSTQFYFASFSQSMISTKSVLFTISHTEASVLLVVLFV